jgi:hypothetical protein
VVEDTPRPYRCPPHVGHSVTRDRVGAVSAIWESIPNGDGLTIMTGGPGSGKADTFAELAVR